MGFYDKMKDTVLEEFNDSVTENGALGYRTTGKRLLDLNFSVASLRSASEKEIVEKFYSAFVENRVAAMKWLFFARDVRGGLGERRLFRVIMKWLSGSEPKLVKDLVRLIPEYGRFDDLLFLLDTEDYLLKYEVMQYIQIQLKRDLDNKNEGKPISLLAKWLPSPNATSKETKRYAKIIRDGLGLTEKRYRKILVELRKYLDVVEVKMSSKRWESIKYEAVPSRANLIYNSAFLRNDEIRRREYLGRLEKGETKINASTLYPHDIVHKYQEVINPWGRYNGLKSDPAIEALWKNLPDTVSGYEDSQTIVVADGSGSMSAHVGKSGVTALEVANSLAIYFAEKLTGEFKDRYITFSEHPQLVDFTGVSTLYGKLIIARQHTEVANTNIEAVFDLILNTAIRNGMKQEEIPANVLIISDMEFDNCARFGRVVPQVRLFDEIRRKYEEAGYKLPRLVFWNVNSRTGTIPVRENRLGVALVSGFSPNIAKMVMSGKLDPYECLMETLNSERYKPVEEAITR